MPSPSFRNLLQSKGTLKAGTFIGEFTTPGIGQILKVSGCDFAMVDMEHTGFSFETIKQTLRSLHDAGVASMTRPPSKEYHHIARLCDMGAQGIMPPMISNAEEAERVVSYMKYVPQGIRGCALGLAHDDYRVGPVDEKLKAANDKTSLVALIESVEGIENIDEIAAVEGLDCLWIGHFDLSCSLGIPGQFDHPVFVSAVEHVIAAGTAHNKPLGRLVPTVEEGVALFKKGFDMILYSMDVGLLRQALTDGLNELRNQCTS